MLSLEEIQHNFAGRQHQNCGLTRVATTAKKAPFHVKEYNFHGQTLLNHEVKT